jgi:hypothetical protein
MVAELVHEETKGLALVFCMKVKGLDHFLGDEYEKASWFFDFSYSFTISITNYIFCLYFH